MYKNFFGFIKQNARFFWAVVFALCGLLLSRFAYFNTYPLLNYSFFGELLVGLSFFFFAYYLGKTISDFISRWFDRVVIESVRRVVSEVSAYQTSRIVEEIKRGSIKQVANPDLIDNQVDKLNTQAFDTSNVKQTRSAKSKIATNQETINIYAGQSSGVVLDTSAIIDGRIVGIIKTGFLDTVFIVPQNVINELQHMADKSNKIKRDKGRRGLDILKEIRKLVGKKRFIIVELQSEPAEVDHSLVDFCKKNNTKIATVDFNLNKAAQVAGVTVLNINQLANEIKLNLLPGELLMVKLVQQGKEDGQAVGYLEDGTMIIVRDADKHIGEHIEVTVDKVLQTNAGRMIFANFEISSQ